LTAVDKYTRAYMPLGRLAHLMRDFGPEAHALCDVTPRRGEWLGTGGQGEYETAGRLPLCGECERIAGMTVVS